ncbi:FAD/NAD(P)-binding oxidoreductase [Flammeovirgaceae bacterium SG7u.111]|nr:FAD/NAD(P)-binding oxidoreductase [Flammeovirgaceae bacterium SG7u.132]WPO36215.1 FAD/NAD(P)-binding oxidoreductase [Flammeovirgaceae bacterium SG7u.111]
MRIAIIGNGISGVTAARHIRKKDSQAEITIISAETKHFFSRTALMYIYMGHMKFENTKPYEDWFWKKNRLNLIYNYVEKVSPEEKQLRFSDGTTFDYDKLVIACGSTPNKFGWPGQDLKGVGGMYSFQDLENIEKYSKDLKKAVIIGGGLIGIELAEMFHSRHIPVTFLVREKSFWNKILPAEESAMVNREIRSNGIDLRLGTELKEIRPDENGRVKSIITSSGEEISCQFVGLTAGVRPNISFLEGSGIATERGVLINHHFETNLPDIYAIGDCAQFTKPIEGRKPLEQVWYTGRMHGEVLAQVILGNRKVYRPGPWFNSAKFFDIEYQTYGDVPAILSDKEESIYWEHENRQKSIRLVYEKASGKFLGANLMGIRFRHEVCDKWLREKRNIKYVLANLSAANFDPEFFKTHEHEVVALYNSKNASDPIELKRRKRLRELIGL